MIADLMSEAELASFLGVSIHTLRFWRKDGRGPASRKVGRRVFYKQADVNTWLENRPSGEREVAA